MSELSILLAPHGVDIKYDWDEEIEQQLRNREWQIKEMEKDKELGRIPDHLSEMAKGKKLPIKGMIKKEG